MRKEKKRILLLENYRQTLAVARSLKQAGYEVHGGIPASTPSAQDRAVAASTAVNALWEHPGFFSPRFPPALQSYCRGQGIDAVFPVGEVSLPVLSDMADGLPPIVSAGFGTVALCLDKARAGVKAGEAGLPLPRSRQASSAAGIQAAVEEVGLPCVIKSRDGMRILLDRKAWVFTAESPRLELLREMAGAPVLVQEFVSGRRVNCMFLAARGRIIAYLEGEVLRTNQMDGTGYATSERSNPPSRELRKYVARLVEHLDYDGPGCAQFLVDGAKVRFLECNPRLDASVPLAVHCGVDFPRLLMENLFDPAAAFRRSGSYREGQYMHWLLGDLEGSLQALVGRRISIAQALAWQGRALKDALRADCASVASWRDPGPALILSRHLLRAIARRLAQRSRKVGQVSG